ncbi:hypothetical protein G6F35_011120 [Rhizopus arrhizus]|nr:hypothetical protein G6F35_011120 [Rhizopus arrhizus]
MDFARIDGNDVAGAGLYPAASAMRDLRARADHADAELVMRVARKGVPAARSHGLHAGERAARHDELAWLHQRADRKGLALVFLHDLLDELGAADFAVLVGVHGGELFRGQVLRQLALVQVTVAIGVQLGRALRRRGRGVGRQRDTGSGGAEQQGQQQGGTDHEVTPGDGNSVGVITSPSGDNNARARHRLTSPPVPFIRRTVAATATGWGYAVPMAMHGDRDDELRLFQTGEHPCGYWSDRVARDLVLDPHDRRLGGLYPLALSWGFRRSGDLVYRPHCAHCQACVAVRIPVARFAPDRSQRRCAARNEDLEVRITAATARDDLFALYHRYLVHRHANGGMDDHGPHECACPATTASPASCWEWR